MHRWSVHTCVGGPVHVKKDTLTTWTQPVVPIWHQCRCGCISPKANWAFRDLHGFKIGTRGYVHAATAFHLIWMGLPSCTCASCAGKDGPHTCKLGLIRNGYLPCSQHLPAVTVQMQTGFAQAWVCDGPQGRGKEKAYVTANICKAVWYLWIYLKS